MGRPVNLPELIIKKVKPHKGLYIAKSKMKAASKLVLYQSIADVLNHEEKLQEADKLDGADIVRMWDNIRKGYAGAPCSYYLSAHLEFLDSHIKSKRFLELKKEGLVKKNKIEMNRKESECEKNLEDVINALPDEDLQHQPSEKPSTTSISSQEHCKKISETLERPLLKASYKPDKKVDKREAEVCSLLNNAVEKLNELVNEDDPLISTDDYMQGIRQALLTVDAEDLLFCVADLSGIMNSFIPKD